jgi:hypothetical protein
MKFFPELVGATAFLLLAMPGARAGVEVAHTGADDAGVWSLRDTATGKTLAVLWNAADSTSGCDFEADGGVHPEFDLSPGGDYLAANGGAPRAREVFLYRVMEKGVASIAIPELSAKQRAPLDAVGDNLSAEGVDAVRWMAPDLLLVHYWADSRVISDSEKPKHAELWAEIALDGDTATISGIDAKEPPAESGPHVATAVPAVQAAEPLLDAATLAGTHECRGRNPDGSTYSGTVKIRVKNGLVLLEWDIAGRKSHGTGLVEGMCLGVALESGVAIYQIVPQAEGKSLVGFWADEGAKTASEETILVGNADIKTAQFPVEKTNGNYRLLRESGDDSQDEAELRLSGGDTRKTLRASDGALFGEGIQLGDGLAFSSKKGFSLLLRQKDDQSLPYFGGHFVDGKGRVSQESLIPADE